METLYRKVQFEINEKDHDEIVLIGKSADFTFNPNTRNGEELFDFLSCCEEIPDQNQIEKLEAEKAELLDALQDILEEIKPLHATSNFYDRVYEKAESAIKKATE